MNETLTKYFGPEWGDVRHEFSDGVEWHMAWDISHVLGLKNVTIAIRGGKNSFNVDPQYRTMVKDEYYNKFRTVHLLTIEGVFQLIMNNKTLECKRIKEYMARGVLAVHTSDFSYRSKMAEQYENSN